MVISPFPDHQSDPYIRKKEQYEYHQLGQRHSTIVNDVELLPGYREIKKLAVNTVYKIPCEQHRTRPEKKHNYAHNKTPDQHLAYYFQRFIYIVWVVHIAPPVRTEFLVSSFWFLVKTK